MGLGQYWTRKGDQEDKDDNIVCPWTEHVGHGDRLWPDPIPEDTFSLPIVDSEQEQGKQDSE